jgi:hypothetical protein
MYFSKIALVSVFVIRYQSGFTRCNRATYNYTHPNSFYCGGDSKYSVRNCQYKKIMSSGSEMLNEASSVVLWQRVLSVDTSLNPFGHRTVEFQCIVVLLVPTTGIVYRIHLLASGACIAIPTRPRR